MDLQRTVQNLNTLARFLGPRDLPEPTPEALKERIGLDQLDAAVLFGGSILCGGDEFAHAMQTKLAKHYIIVGGEGHTTETLRQVAHAACSGVETAGLPEAKVFAAYLSGAYGLVPDALECTSTNCGNNITHLLDLMREKGFDCGSFLLIQDASMQRRMEAGLRKYVPEARIVNYAAYQAELVVRENHLAFAQPIFGMWQPKRYIDLLMGEIPRLRDDADGYGPNGRGFIAHVDIPPEVEAAFAELRSDFSVREANPLYASRA